MLVKGLFIILSVILLAISLQSSVLETQVEKFLLVDDSKSERKQKRTYLASPLSSPGSGVGDGVAWSVTSPCLQSCSRDS